MERLNSFMKEINLRPILEFCQEHGRIVNYAKGERFANQGEVCRVIGVVQSGYFKYIAHDSNDEEHVTGFSFTGEVVCDYIRSFLFNLPSMTSIVAGNNASVLQVPVANARQHMQATIPDFVENATQVMLHEAYRRYLDIMTMTPAERYAILHSHYGHVIDTVSYQELASYLNISRRQLQRIRENFRSSQ